MGVPILAPPEFLPVTDSGLYSPRRRWSQVMKGTIRDWIRQLGPGLIGGPAHVYAVVFGMTCLLLQVFLTYQRYVRYLKWLTLALLSYVVLVLTIHIPWREVIAHAVTPHFALTTEYLTVIVAVFGTTISPYLF